jgi:hypothetical protein
VKAAEVEWAKELVRDLASWDQSHQVELHTLQERTDLVQDRAALDVQTAQALAGRLRQERNQARQDALSYNHVQNEARTELIALRTRQLAAAQRLSARRWPRSSCCLRTNGSKIVVSRAAACIIRNMQSACLHSAE